MNLETAKQICAIRVNALRGVANLILQQPGREENAANLRDRYCSLLDRLETEVGFRPADPDKNPRRISDPPPENTPFAIVGYGQAANERMCNIALSFSRWVRQEDTIAHNLTSRWYYWPVGNHHEVYIGPNVFEGLEAGGELAVESVYWRDFDPLTITLPHEDPRPVAVRLASIEESVELYLQARHNPPPQPQT